MSIPVKNRLVNIICQFISFKLFMNKISSCWTVKSLNATEHKCDFLFRQPIIVSLYNGVAKAATPS